MQNRDILWAISLPFRMYNKKELDINKCIFILSFDTALPNINVTTARQLISLALKKGWINKVEGENLLHANFELWEPKFFPLNWHPNFTNLQQTPTINLTPLDSTIEYKPKISKRIKKVEPLEVSPLSPRKKTKEKKKQPVKKPKKKAGKKKAVKKEETEEIQIKTTPEKKKAPKKQKRKGQKSIQDFFGK